VRLSRGGGEGEEWAARLSQRRRGRGVGGGGSGVGGALWLRWEGGCGGRVGGRPYIGRVRGGGQWAGTG
jgi:hypothetical protein